MAVYYLPGTLLGSFLGGWFGDRYGRILTIAVGSVWAVVGAVLQCSAMNSDWMFCGKPLSLHVGAPELNALQLVYLTVLARAS